MYVNHVNQIHKDAQMHVRVRYIVKHQDIPSLVYRSWASHILKRVLTA